MTNISEPANTLQPADARRWAVAAFSNDPAPATADSWLDADRPFSFVYDGRPWIEQRQDWKYQKITDEPLKKSIEWADPRTGLAVTCEIRQFDDFPAVDWVLWFENRGTTNTPIIEQIRTLNAPMPGPFPFTIHATQGGRSLDDDFMPFDWKINDATSTAALTSPEFSSNYHSPFFAIENGANEGVVIGVGWSSGWRATFEPEDGKLQMRVGVKRGEYYLKPGEKVRAARILMMFWKGDYEAARNQFRQLLYQHYIPKFKGKPHEPLVTVNTCFTYNGGGGFLEKANAYNIRPLVEPFASIGAEGMVIDACWYDGEPWYDWQGNWTPSKRRYPEGFKTIAEACARHGMYFGLWFTPETVSPTVAFAREHPEWITWRPRIPGNNKNGSLSLHRPEAREWFLNQVDDLVTSYGINFYRNDGAAEWYTEGPGRNGFGEAIHVAGLYELWDTLRERYPDMVMEGCMGGGRRIDLETIQRFLWHQKSDRWFQTEPDQTAVYGANLFLPGGLINLPTERTDDYGCWSSFGGQLCLAWDPIDTEFPRAKARDQVMLYKKVRHLFSGDFHPLTPCTVDGPWIAYQFHRPDLDEGIILIFRRTGGEADNMTFTAQPAYVDRKTEYEIHAQSENTSRKSTGDEMLKGIVVKVNNKPAAEMLVYKGIK